MVLKKNVIWNPTATLEFLSEFGIEAELAQIGIVASPSE